MDSYPTDGARVLAETGKTKFQLVLDEADLGEDASGVALLANEIMHRSPGWIPSTAASEAVRRYRRNSNSLDGIR